MQKTNGISNPNFIVFTVKEEHMRKFFFIIAGLFIINIVHADIGKKDLEALHVLIQENKPLAEIEASDVWRKLATPTEEDIRVMREYPAAEAEQGPFMKFHNRDMMDIYRYIWAEIEKCEANNEYDHAIELLDKLYSLSRLHILDVVDQNSILKKKIYPLFVGNKLTFTQKKRLLDNCDSKLVRLPLDKFSFIGPVLVNGVEKHDKIYVCTLVSSEFIIHVMKSLISNDEDFKIEHEFEERMKKMLEHYGLTGVYQGAVYTKPKGNFKFYLITKEPLYFYRADHNGYIDDGVQRVRIEKGRR